MIKKILQSIWFKMLGKQVVEKLGFSCCFCNQGITSADPDPSEMVIVANIEEPKEQQVNQVFWCHAQCLKIKMHGDMKSLFVLDDITKQKNK